MKIIGAILGTLLGAWVAEWEGAIFGLAIGLLTGAHLNSRRRIARLEQDIRSLQDRPRADTQTPAKESPPASDSIPESTDTLQAGTAGSGWRHPEIAEDPMLAANLIVPAKGMPDRATAASAPGSEQAAAPAAAGEYIPGPFEKLQNAMRHFFTGGNVVVKAGMIILFFGVSFLLKYVAEKDLFPIELRLAGIAAGGIALLVFGWRLRLRKTLYALVMQGGGVGILYLTVFAAARLYQLIPMGPVFVLLVALVVFSCALAVIQNARSLAIFATVGGFLAPVLTSTGQGSHVALFSYYALLNAGILGIAWYRAWRSLNWLGFVFTFVIASLWGARYYQPHFFTSTEPFLILFFLFYVAIPVLYAQRQPPELKGLVDGTLVFGTPLVGFGLQSALVRNFEFGQAYSALAIGAVYLLLARALWTRQLQGMRMLTEAFLALAVIFLSLAIPLAMDGHWTAAAWSLEGAGITWISIRQKRLAGRIFGLLLQAGAGVAFLSAIDLPHGYTPGMNSAFLGSILIGIAGLFTAYQYYRCRDRVGQQEQYNHMVLLAWGLLWWFGAGITELDQFVSREYSANVILLYCGLSFLLLHAGGRKFGWPVTAYPPLLLLPLMLLFAGLAFIDGVNEQPFEKLGYLAWPLCLLIQYYLLHQNRDTWPENVMQIWHAATLWLILFLLAWFVSFVMVRHVEGMHNWDLIFWAVVPAIFVMLLLNFGERLDWPVQQYKTAYLGAGLFPVIACLGIWTLLICFRENDPAPLPWIPVLNPYDIAQLFVMFNLFNWCWTLKENKLPRLPDIEPDVLLLALAAIVFAWLNSLLAHGVYYYADIPFRLNALLRSELFQTLISILWTVIALAMMLTATRIVWRRLWFAGGVLLAVTIVKLFIVDLADSGTVTRIVSFLSVGGLMLVIGYYSPAPPRQAAESHDGA
ncbi:MAG: DUF2339 domain-containing protein [Thiotrichales bacterium]|nr:DUF2339 domain-containing protein [Thiotrichales bacterium]